MRDVFITGAGWWASGQAGGLGVSAARLEKVRKLLYEQNLIFPTPAEDIAQWHLALAKNWRLGARQAFGGLDSCFWSGLVPATENNSSNKISEPAEVEHDPALFYAALAGALSGEPFHSDRVSRLSSPSRWAVLMGSSKGPFAHWLSRLDRIRQGGKSVQPPFQPEFDFVNQQLVRQFQRFGHSCPQPARTSPADKISDQFPTVFANCPVSACATGLRAIIDACRQIAWNTCDEALAGASDASIHRLTLAAYQNMGLLSPRGVCEPWGKQADGFFVGEGAGILRLSAERPHQADNTNNNEQPVWRVAGWISTADPTGLILGDPVGRPLQDTLRRLLARVGWRPQDVTAIKPHATGTPVGDAAEQAAVRELWSDQTQLRVYLPKRKLGHCLGAAGAVELAWTLEQIAKDYPANKPCRLLAWSQGFGGGIEAIAVEKH